MSIDGWRIHRRIGMSGGLFARALGRELDRELSDEETSAVQDRHGQIFRELVPDRRTLPGTRDLLASLRGHAVDHGIATSGRRPEINASLAALGVDEGTVVVERCDVARAKPQPDLFLECARRLNVAAEDCFVVGDAVWDLLAARRAEPGTRCRLARNGAARRVPVPEAVRSPFDQRGSERAAHRAAGFAPLPSS